MGCKMKFQKHTSAELVDLFTRKPFQGQYPEKAEIVFLSSDANYSPKISEHAFFNKILEYQNEGVAFWEKYKCHHPFLLSEYPFNKNKAGVPFHRNFSKIGLSPEYASKISFLELLDIPTIGNKSQDPDLFYSLISKEHLKFIDRIILGGGNKLFFVSNGVLKNMMKLKKDYQVFSWLDRPSNATGQYSETISGNKIQEIYHFSSWQIHGQLSDIYLSITNWVNGALGKREIEARDRGDREGGRGSNL